MAPRLERWNEDEDDFGQDFDAWEDAAERDRKIRKDIDADLVERPKRRGKTHRRGKRQSRGGWGTYT